MLNRLVFIFFASALCVADEGESFTSVRRGFMDSATLSCAQAVEREARNKLLGIVVGGKGSGSQIPLVAKELGFQIVHIYPNDLPNNVTKTFPSVFDFPPIVYNPRDQASVLSVGTRIRELTSNYGYEVAGFIAGMDYGVTLADELNASFKTPGNVPNIWRSHKGLLNRHLGDLGVPVVLSQSLALDEVADAVSNRQFPLHLKPVNSSGSIGAGACPTMAHLRGLIERMKADTRRENQVLEEIVVEDLLHEDTIYIVNTVSALWNGIQKRIVTGVEIDSRGDEFPREVWDIIAMLPPPHLLGPQDAKLFNFALQQNQLVLDKSKVATGVTHLEFMARGARETIVSASELLPIDLNLRQPGLDLPRLEMQATGVDPYVLEIASHTYPEVLMDFPEVYANWHQAVALIFLRSHWNGRVSQRGMDWLNSLMDAPAARTDGAYLTRLLVPPVGSPVVPTVNGRSIQGVVHAVGPNLKSIYDLHAEIRNKEKEKFFVD